MALEDLGLEDVGRGDDWTPGHGTRRLGNLGHESVGTRGRDSRT